MCAITKILHNHLSAYAQKSNAIKTVLMSFIIHKNYIYWILFAFCKCLPIFQSGKLLFGASWPPFFVVVVVLWVCVWDFLSFCFIMCHLTLNFIFIRCSCTSYLATKFNFHPVQGSFCLNIFFSDFSHERYVSKIITFL